MQELRANQSLAVARNAGAFSLAELLVVCGILALLLAIMLPPLQLARRQAMRTQCAAQLQQTGLALDQCKFEFGFYPFPDDGGYPIRYTWIDVLIQRRFLGGGRGAMEGATARNASRFGYCPEDPMPDPLNVARHPDLIYPPTRTQGGEDYSYGIGVPLAFGGWAALTSDDGRPRRFRNHELNASGRLLVADATNSAVYNLSGRALITRNWNEPTQYDNTIAWGRHSLNWAEGAGANVLFQDSHISQVRYHPYQPEPINTSAVFVWRPGESVYTNHADFDGENYYPDQLPPSFQSVPQGTIYPNDLLPVWYTETLRWTLIQK